MLNFSKYHIRRFVASLSISLLSVNVDEIGQYDVAYFWSFCGLQYRKNDGILPGFRQLAPFLDSVVEF